MLFFDNFIFGGHMGHVTQRAKGCCTLTAAVDTVTLAWSLSLGPISQVLAGGELVFHTVMNGTAQGKSKGYPAMCLWHPTPSFSPPICSVELGTLGAGADSQTHIRGRRACSNCHHYYYCCCYYYYYFEAGSHTAHNLKLIT